MGVVGAAACHVYRLMPIGAPTAAGSEGHGFCGGRFNCQCPAPVGHHYAAVEPLLDLHLSANVAGPEVIS